MTERSTKSKLIQLVKIGQKQLNLDDDLYRAVLKQQTGKTSATQCTIVELHKVIHHFQTKGAKLHWYGKKSLKASEYSPVTGSQAVLSEVVHKIRAVWITMGKGGFLKDPSEKGLTAFIRALLNRGRVKKGETYLLLFVHTLTQKQAVQVLETLKSWHGREMLNILNATREVLPKKTPYAEVCYHYHALMGVAK